MALGLAPKNGADLKIGPFFLRSQATFNTKNSCAKGKNWMQAQIWTHNFFVIELLSAPKVI
jgi:hypothetical protein